MSFVVINVLTVPEPMRATLEERFANRAGEVETMDGFEHFELLRPVEGQDSYLVYTRWQTEEHFKGWMESQAFTKGHAQSSEQGPASTGSQIWTFQVAEAKSKS
jgi:heme oxygenase (mycobilin-producing)